MSYTFHLPKIETRRKDLNGVPSYIVKGYATTPDNVYTYKTTGDRAFKEYFTSKALESLRKKLKNEKVFVDAEHITATKHSSEKILEDIQQRASVDVSEQINYIKDRFKFSDIPMFKVEDVKVDDHGLFVEIQGNPFYRNVDEEHASYFDAVWNSIENGFINGMSLNFKPSETLQVNEGLTQIDDIDVYGISLTAGAANDMANITEVAMRSIEHRGESKCQKRKKMKKLLM